MMTSCIAGSNRSTTGGEVYINVDTVSRAEEWRANDASRVDGTWLVAAQLHARVEPALPLHEGTYSSIACTSWIPLVFICFYFAYIQIDVQILLIALNNRFVLCLQHNRLAVMTSPDVVEVLYRARAQQTVAWERSLHRAAWTSSEQLPEGDWRVKDARPGSTAAS